MSSMTRPEENHRGPKRKYAGAIDKKNLDLTKMEEIHVEGVEGTLHSCRQCYFTEEECPPRNMD